jgi:polar amino acid transport system substrate-binding protein
MAGLACTAMPRISASALRHASVLVGFAIVLVLLVCRVRVAQAAPPVDEPAPIVVAVKQAAPFAVRTADGHWTGTSIELWRAVAAELELDYTLHETTLEDMIAGVAEGRYQAAVAALTVTSEREQIVDFTHPFHTTGLAIAVSSKGQPYWRGVLQTVFSWTFLELIAVLALMQLVVGTVVWLLERRANAEQFPAAPSRGVPTGFWWAIVTMTTVGYGDKAPKSALGRAVALVWMLASMVIVASVTATIASSLTIERLDARIRGPEDLHRFEVGVIAGTTAASFLRDEKIVTRSFADADTALEALSRAEIDALVWDAPLLRGAIFDHPQLAIELVPGVFQRQDYAIAVGEGSELREAINRVLPEKLRGLDFE